MDYLAEENCGFTHKLLIMQQEVIRLPGRKKGCVTTHTLFVMDWTSDYMAEMQQ